MLPILAIEAGPPKIDEGGLPWPDTERSKSGSLPARQAIT